MASPYPDRVNVECPICHKTFEVIRSQLKKRPNACCSRQCGAKNQRGKKIREKNPAWKGGRRIDPRTGYVYVLVGIKKYRLEHRVVVEQQTGTSLDRGTHVHHKNRNKGDNDPCNLQPLPATEHTRLHSAGRKRKPWKMNRWSKHGATHCSCCGRSDRPHKSHGLCSFCYESQRTKQRSWKKETYGQRIKG
jgi:hypothetical protein